MFRLITTLTLILFLSFSASAIDIKSACNERDEQKKALLSKMSTSISEAMLAGQCIGYKQVSNNNSNIFAFAEISQACAEFIEQKEALLPFHMSTSLSEAMLAGMCIGAIYKIAKGCNSDERNINYHLIAKGIMSTHESQAAFRIDAYLDCR